MTNQTVDERDYRQTCRMDASIMYVCSPTLQAYMELL